MCDVWKRKRVSWKLVSVSRVCFGHIMFGNKNLFLGNWFPFPGFVLDTLYLETETCFLENGFRFQGLLGLDILCLETETCFLETGFRFHCLLG